MKKKFLIIMLVLALPVVAARLFADSRDQMDSNLLFDGETTLNRESLIKQVLERNPGMEAAHKAWEAAIFKANQLSALPDPFFSASLAPGSIGGGSTGYVLRARQRFPFPGKRTLNKAVGLAKAGALHEDYKTMRVKLASISSALYDDYYMVIRSLEVNSHHITQLENLKQSANIRYAAGTGSQQDAIQADLERATLVQKRWKLETKSVVIQASLNGLLHRDPRDDLPLPPAEFPQKDFEPEDLPHLFRAAEKNRPELLNIRAKVKAQELSLKLAQKSYFPDFEVFTSHNTMWMNPDHRYMFGVGLNAPLQLGRRKAETKEKQAMLMQRQKEYDYMLDKVKVEITTALQIVQESKKIVKQYEAVLKPLSGSRVEAARAGYESGKNDFQILIEAENSYQEIELGYHRALAELYRGAAALDRAIGKIPFYTLNKGEM